MKRVALVALAVLAVGVAAVPVVAQEGSGQDASTTKQQELTNRWNSAQPGGKTLAAKALAANTCVADPSGDVTDIGAAPASNPRADIIGYCINHTGSTIDANMTLAEATDGNNEPAWDSTTGVKWVFDVDLDDYADYEATLFWISGGWRASVWVAGTSTRVCEATGGLSSGAYRVSFPASCIDAGSTVHSIARMLMSSDKSYFDSAPNSGVMSTSASSAPPPTAPPPPPSAPPPPPPAGKVGRLASGDRIGTAIVISQYAFPNGATTVFLANAFNFPDALAGGELTTGPVLLVPPCGPLPQPVKDEIRRLSVDKVMALGGTNAICDGVLAEAAASM